MMHGLVCLLLYFVAMAAAGFSDDSEQAFICTATTPAKAHNASRGDHCSSDELALLINQLLDNFTANNGMCDTKKLHEKLQTIETQLESITANLTNIHASLDKLKIFVSQLPSPLQSCTEVAQKWPLPASGFYPIVDAKGNVVTAFCEMGSLCSQPGPWTRIAFLNMSDHSTNCPLGLSLYTRNSVRACGRSQSDCQSLYFNSPLGGYRAVCGMVKGYQYKTPDAFVHGYGKTIDGTYVDGVSITYGFTPRKHLWTYAAGYSQSKSGIYDCPCSKGHTQTAPDFVGNNYYCESGNQDGTSAGSRLYEEDPLWDNKGCGSHEQSCCQQSSLQPWFHRSLPSTVSEPIELRICGNEPISNDDVPLSEFELYVQ